MWPKWRKEVSGRRNISLDRFETQLKAETLQLTHLNASVWFRIASYFRHRISVFGFRFRVGWSRFWRRRLFMASSKSWFSWNRNFDVFDKFLILKSAKSWKRFEAAASSRQKKNFDKKLLENIFKSLIFKLSFSDDRLNLNQNLCLPLLNQKWSL